MNLSKNFKSDEFKCHCNKCDGGKMSEAFIERLQKLRDLLNFPLVITSGYRCEAHNKSEGGHNTSMHMLGRAADISASNGALKYALMCGAMTVGFKGIGIGKTFVHVDDRDDQTAWTY